nr:PREDICTED: hydroxysteroid dehydrogenase-like protein 2 [Linepithema humile]
MLSLPTEPRLSLQTIHTAAMDMLSGSESSNFCRKPEIMADAVYALLCKDSKSITGKFLIDEDILRNEGVNDFTDYACNPANKDNLMLDFFLGDNIPNVQDEKTKHLDKTSSNETGQVARIFSAIDANLNSELVNKTGAIYQFNVKGKESGTWFLDLKNGNGAIGKGEPSQPADATLTMDSDNFFAMFSGKLKPTAAFMTGKLNINGNLQKAMKLEKLMSSLKSKL